MIIPEPKVSAEDRRFKTASMNTLAWLTSIRPGRKCINNYNSSFWQSTGPKLDLVSRTLISQAYRNRTSGLIRPGACGECERLRFRGAQSFVVEHSDGVELRE